MNTSRSLRYVRWALPIAAAWVIALALAQRQRDFWDDTFIYLHIASNIVEHWSARYFQSTNNWALLASSPIRLALLLPGIALSTLVGKARTLQGAILALQVTLVVSALVAFYASRALGRKRLGLFLLLAIPWLMPMFTSMLQMEGALTLVGGALGFAALRSRKLSFLFATGTCLAFARLELGVAFGVAALILALGDRRVLHDVSIPRRAKRNLGRAVLWVVLPLTAWVLLCASWRVWPVPVTYLLKAITAEARLLGGLVHENIGTRLLEWLRLDHLDPRRIYTTNTMGMALAGAFLVAISLPQPYRYNAQASGRMARFIFLALYFSIVCRGANTFVWYHENVALTFIGAALEVLDATWEPMPFLRKVAAALTVALSIQGTYINGAHRRLYHEDFSSEAGTRSIGNLYQRLSQNRDPASPLLFHPTLGPYVLYTCEIGMLAYFGNNVWVRDHCGLAHGGDLVAKYPKKLAKLYPKQALPTADAEQEALMRTYSISKFRTVGYRWNPDSTTDCFEYGKPAYPGMSICFFAIP